MKWCVSLLVDNIDIRSAIQESLNVRLVEQRDSNASGSYCDDLHIVKHSEVVKRCASVCVSGVDIVRAVQESLR